MCVLCIHKEDPSQDKERATYSQTRRQDIWTNTLVKMNPSIVKVINTLPADTCWDYFPHVWRC